MIELAEGVTALKHQNVKTCWGVEINLHVFLISTVYGGEK
jgi:hypothetical protein